MSNSIDMVISLLQRIDVGEYRKAIGQGNFSKLSQLLDDISFLQYKTIKQVPALLTKEPYGEMHRKTTP
jgi:hypothetical protein